MNLHAYGDAYLSIIDLPIHSMIKVIQGQQPRSSGSWVFTTGIVFERIVISLINHIKNTKREQTKTDPKKYQKYDLVPRKRKHSLSTGYTAMIRAQPHILIT
jgi:hypothetical protein